MSTEAIVILFLCLLFLAAAFFYYRRHRAHAREVLQLKSSIVRLKNQVDREGKVWRREFDEQADALGLLQERNASLQEDALRALREDWLRELRDVEYRNEIEVETKFLYPLLRFLGHPSSTIQMRVPVNIQTGRQTTTVVADWVVWQDAQAQFVLEAKEPGISLGTGAQGQARSYAFGLGAPAYALTNGHEIQVFRRGVQEDTRVFDVDIKNLARLWPELERAMGNRAGTAAKTMGEEARP